MSQEKRTSRRRFLQYLFAAGIVTYGASKFGKLVSLAEALQDPAYQTSSVPRVDINYTSHPIGIDGKWKDDWNNATLIDVPNLLPSKYATYPYSGKTGYAYSRLMDDDEWLYGNFEYYPPPNESGQRGFKPAYLEIYFDTQDDKNDPAQPDDYYFNLFPGSGYFKGIYYAQGLGHFGDKSGYSGGSPWTNGYPGWELKDSSLAQHAFSVIPTPTFETPHPYYEFKFSKNKLGLKNPFGLGVFVYDGQIVSKKNGGTIYVAAFPANDQGETIPDIWTSPSVWADAYFSEGITTQTIISSLTSKSRETPPITSSTSISKTETSIAKTDFDSLQKLIEVLLGGVSIAGISAYGLYRYFKKNHPDVS